VEEFPHGSSRCRSAVSLVGAAPGIDECAQPLIQPSQGFYPFRALQFFVLCCQVVNWAVACRKRRQKCGCCKVLRRLCCLKCDAAFVVDVEQGAVRLHGNYRILPNGTNGLDLMFAE
jgi:hypothetical protein